MEKDTFKAHLVSVIIPVFNAENVIASAIESVLSQTYNDIEIIIVDDQSSDNSVDIILEIKETHPDIILCQQETNKGVGYARNRALSIANGQYVAFLDADDLWKPDKIEKQLKLLQDKQGGFCFTAIEMIDGSNAVIKSKRRIKLEVDYNTLLSNTIIPTSSVLIDRFVFGDFRMNVRRGGQDYATWLNLLRNGMVAYGVDEALVSYRINGKSLSSNKLKSIQQIWDIQTKDEGISAVATVWNILRWSVNSIRKYWF